MELSRPRLENNYLIIFKATFHDTRESCVKKNCPKLILNGISNQSK